MGSMALLRDVRPPTTEKVKTVLALLEAWFEGLAENASRSRGPASTGVPYRRDAPYDRPPSDPRLQPRLQPRPINAGARMDPRVPTMDNRMPSNASSYAHPRMDSRSDPRLNSRSDPRLNSRSDPRLNSRSDPRMVAQQVPQKTAPTVNVRKAAPALKKGTALHGLINQYMGYLSKAAVKRIGTPGFPTPQLPTGCTLSWGGMRKINVIQWNLMHPLHIKQRGDMGLISALNIINNKLSEKCTVREVLLMKMVKMLTKKHDVICLQDCTGDFLYELDEELGEKWDMYDTHAPPNNKPEHDFKHFGVILYNTEELISLGGQDDAVEGYYNRPGKDKLGTSFIQYHLFEINRGMCRREKFNIVNTEIPPAGKTTMDKIHYEFLEYTMKKARLAWYKTKQPAPLLVAADVSQAPPQPRGRLRRVPSLYPCGPGQKKNPMYFLEKDGMGANAVGMKMLTADKVLHGLSTFIPTR